MYIHYAINARAITETPGWSQSVMNLCNHLQTRDKFSVSLFWLVMIAAIVITTLSY